MFGVMSLLAFQIRDLDGELERAMGRSSDGSACYSIDANTSFWLQGVLEAPMSADCFMEINTETRNARETFTGLIKKATGQPIGTFTIKDCCVLGRVGLLIDPVRQICWIGRTIGWNQSLLRDLSAALGFGEVVDNETILIDSDWVTGPMPDSDSGLTENAFLLAQPGFNIFGHWLVDILPRLHFGSRHPRWSHASLIAPPISAWGAELAKVYGVDFDRHLCLHDRSVVRVKELSIFSCIKSRIVLDKPFANAAWDVLRSAYAGAAIDRNIMDCNAKIYVSRSSVQTDRRFENALEIEQYFRHLGWAVVHPEKLSLASQAAVFAQASVIAGDDGSALHNSIHSKPETKILCLDFQRANMFHASVANVLGHKLAYLDSDKVVSSDGVSEWEMPIPRLAEAIGMIENV